MTESTWIQQLYEEHRQICFLYRLKLKTPVIRLADWQGKWGEWDPLTRTITLSTLLIRQFRWDTVLEIFKHELAHQIVTELDGEDEIHGPYFQRACKRLAVAAWARRAETELTISLISQSE